MRFGVVIFPGTWSDMDFHHVISQVLHQPVEYVWHRDTDVDRFDCLILPGGFSYGDYLRAGAVAGRSPIVISRRPSSAGTPARSASPAHSARATRRACRPR